MTYSVGTALLRRAGIYHKEGDVEEKMSTEGDMIQVRRCPMAWQTLTAPSTCYSARFLRYSGDWIDRMTYLSEKTRIYVLWHGLAPRFRRLSDVLGICRVLRISMLEQVNMDVQQMFRRSQK